MGSPRITAELNGAAEQADGRVNRERVARPMRAAGICGYRRRRPVRTTVPDRAGAKCPDPLKRDFTAPAPNRRYVGDITRLLLAAGGNLYLATVIDCYSRRLVGWALRDHMRTSLVIETLQRAAATRGSLKGATFHSDHGSVYTSKAFATACEKLEVTRSMGAVGTSADNALAESMGATLKREILMDERSWPDELTCRRQTFRWLNRYNTVRRHSYCGHLPPITYEKQTSATTLATAAQTNPRVQQ